jgi:DNA-binding MarR family transcriptional regulator
MPRRQRTLAGEALTGLILEVFQLNGLLLVSGDRLVAGLGITSARWQVLGAIALAQAAQPVAWIARRMGLNRQGVQRIVNELVEEGLVGFENNPNHRRAKLVVLTRRGREICDAAEKLQIPWVNALGKQLHVAEIAAARRIVTVLHERLATALEEQRH